jgi:hypothetical protein
MPPPRRCRRPRAAVAQAVPQIQPAPGGVRREYWIQAESVRWAITPTKRDDWHNRGLGSRNGFTAYVYRLMTPGFAGYATKQPVDPRPDADRRGRRRAGRALPQRRPQARPGGHDAPARRQVHAEYDGAYMGQYTRAGGFIAPGESFTYQWECTPQSVGAWPYHDHGPNHTLNTFRGLFGPIIVRPRGAKAPDRLYTLFAHQLPPPVTRLSANFHCINGRAYAGNTPTADRARRPGRRDPRLRHGLQLPHVPHPRPPLEDPAGTFTDNPPMGPNESVTARFVEDNPGRWLYHCHVFSIRTRGWRAGTSSTPRHHLGEASNPARRRGGGRADRARHRERTVISPAQGPRSCPVEA